MIPLLHPRPYLLAALLAFLLAGCATHAPMSEMVIFHSPATHPAYQSRHGFGVEGTYSPTSLETAEALERFRYPGPGGTKVFNPHQLSLGWHITTFDLEARYAWSLTLGILAAGLDGTVHLSGRNYLTAGVSLPGQIQAFLQHRTFNSQRLAAVLGVGLRRDAYIFDGNDYCSCFVDNQQLISLGARGSLVYRGQNDGRGGGIKVGVYAGYAPAIRQPMLDLTLTFAQF